MRPANRRRTLGIAGVVGSCLVAINQLGPLLHGPRTTLLWVRVALDYLVPLTVSNLGVLAGTRRTPPDPAARPAPETTDRGVRGHDGESPSTIL
jgi:hypothetical protein